MKNSLLLLGLLLVDLSLAQNRTIEKLNQLSVDGSFNEWRDITAHTYSSTRTKRTAGIQATGRKPFNTWIDVEAELKFGWNEEGLALAISWRDDVFDTEDLPRAMGRWAHPDGSQRDRMYYYDNMALRFFGKEDHYYGIWLTPNEFEPFQWNTLRQGPRGTPSSEIPSPEIATRKVENGHLFMEVFWTWDQLKIKPNVGDEATVQIILIDMDEPGQALEVKDQNLVYLHSRQTMRFSN